MNHWWRLALAGILVWGGLEAGHGQALGQVGAYTPPYPQRPAVSPYLNLNRFGANPAINYYGLVQPQQQMQQQLMNLQNQQNLLAGAAPGAQVTPLDQQLPLSTTGHPV